MITDVYTYLPEAILTKVDRASMSVSLESRAPFLDHRLIEWSLRLPPELVNRKRVLKSLLYRRVPRELVDRPKIGFAVPLASWLRHELRDLAFDMLEPSRMASVGITRAGEVERLLAEHMSGHRDRNRQLWVLLVLSLWYEQNVR
jgi:asparagine synthase (glutamine-hydrolysing)